MKSEDKSLSTGQIVTFIATFVLMCFLRLPFTLFILFGFALVLTLAQGRKSYCAHYCPLGAIQDYYPPKENPPKPLPAVVRHARLWQSILLIMSLSMTAALILQTFVRKRVWCSKVCPFGKVLDGAVKVRRLNFNRRQYKA